MALLATKRFLTKNQIFESVDGYEGSPETKERMFERDKTELRALGLDIEVGTEDPLFDDESGYRINPQSYSLKIGELDSQDLSLLSLAASQWQNSVFSKSSQSALRKIEALHGALDREVLDLPFHHSEVPDARFSDLWRATQERRGISFTYRGVAQTERSIQPYALYLLDGRWYLVGFDLDKNEFRQFKISRISGDISIDGKSFSPSKDFSLERFLSTNERGAEVISLQIVVRKGRGQELRATYPVAEGDDDWDLISLSDIPQDEIFEIVARCGDSAKITTPVEVQKKFLAWIEGKRNG